MNDLELWQRLSNIDADEDPAELAASVRALAEHGPRERAAFFGFAESLLVHTSPLIRGAGVALLAGARGHTGLERIVSSLDDEDADVRSQAVRALRKSVAAAPYRWAHAMFHPRLDVRRLAMDVEPPGKLDALRCYLRADPELRDLARSAPWPTAATGLVFDMLLRGHVDRAEAGEALSRMPSLDLRTLLVRGVRRTAQQVGNGLFELEQGNAPSSAERDLLDLWCRVYWDCDAQRPALLLRLAEAVLAPGHGLRARTAFALLLHGHAHGHLPETLQLCAACHPTILLGEGLTVDERRLAAQGLALHRARLGRIKPAVVDALLESPLVGVGSSFDLSLAAVFAAFVPSQAIATLRRIAGDEVLVQRVASTPRAWSSLAELPDDEVGGPTWFLPRLAALDADAAAGFAAAAAPHWLSQSTAAKHNAKKPLLTMFDRLVAWLDGATGATVLTTLARSETAAKTLRKITDAFLPKLAPDDQRELCARLLPLGDRDGPQIVLQHLLRSMGVDRLVPTIVALDAAVQKLFCRHAEVLAIPRAEEVAIARALSKHADADVSGWAEEVLGLLKAEEAPSSRRTVGARDLTIDEMHAIATADEARLPSALRPALETPSRGLCAALRRRNTPAEPAVAVCVALLGSRDPLREVAAQLDRFGDASDAFVVEFAPRAVEAWQGSIALPPLGNALLHRWERHGFALLAWMDGLPGGLGEALHASASLDEALPRRILWEGIASAVLLRRYRQGARLEAWSTAGVMTLLVKHLDTELGPHAARMLATFHRTTFAAEHLDRLRDHVVMLAPDMDAATRRELDPWVRIDGLGARGTPARIRVAKLSADRILAIRTADDIDWLVDSCASRNVGVVHEAVLRLVELRRRGQRALLGLLTEPPSEAAMLAVAESVSLWTDDEALERARGMARLDTLPSQLRFRIAVALHERPEHGWGVVALAAAAAPSPATWLTVADWNVLRRAVPDPKTLSVALVGSPHPHAYQRSVNWLLECGDDDAPSLAALRVFLRAGTHRPAYLRRAAARRLLEHGDHCGVVVCLGEVLDSDETSDDWLLRRAGRDQRARLVAHTVDAALLGGRDHCTEERCAALVRSTSIDTETRDAALQRLLMHGSDAKVREQLVGDVTQGRLRDVKLGQVSELFAWGVRKGRELTGRLFSVHMTQRREDLGYTRMTEDTIYVSALPLMRGDRHGRDVVEALILHEYGHQLYHRDAQSQRIWNRAHKEGIGSLLNLVADEHLERRLRALDATYGDRLKRLAAYAFQHTNRELAVANLLTMLQASSFEALSAKALGVAFEENCVVVDSGLVLRELDRRGHPFARFVRAMRMGLGNRHGDPLLERALSLFKGGFRHHDMRGLYAVAVELSLLYGSQSALAKAYGGHESLEWGDREGSVHGSGIGDDEVQQEVERILKPPGPGSGGPRDSKRGRLQINVGGDDAFREINRVERIPPERERYRQIALEVRRHAFRLRTYFQEIGLSLVPRRARLRGRAFDRTRVRAVVTRQDPRMLVARELEVHTDLFIGVVIDCSGSMSAGRSMEKAHRFGVLLAEAARGLPGVDARFFGFTDSVIYDAGSDQRCGVTRLEPGGGNNDAAGLYYAATVAATSTRRAKLLVMISDGLPTECSVQSVRNLVSELSRRKGIVCAQVAVRPLTEVCFPHYIELLEPELDRAVRRFGEIISGLARRALRR